MQFAHIILTNYITINHTDIKYYASIVGVICLFAYILNNIFDSNLMFISKDFPGTPITILYNISGELFTTIMIVLQATAPFYIVYGVKYIVMKFVIKNVKKLYWQKNNLLYNKGWF